MTLYEKITTGKRIRYVEHVPANSVPVCDAFDSAELVTLGTSLGIMILMILEKQLPPHARNARKIKAVEDAVLDLARGHCAPITEEMMQYWVDAWNHTMIDIQAGLAYKGDES